MLLRWLLRHAWLLLEGGCGGEGFGSLLGWSWGRHCERRICGFVEREG